MVQNNLLVDYEDEGDSSSTQGGEGLFPGSKISRHIRCRVVSWTVYHPGVCLHTPYLLVYSHFSPTLLS